jgi:dienelactone hydrolase
MTRFVPMTIVAVLLAASVAAAEIVPISPDETVLPADTDPEIHAFNHPQAVYHPKGTRRDQLFVLLTGTGGNGPFALRLSTNAALLGYHVIQPMYPDDIPASVCRNDKDSAAFATFRTAIIEGGSSPYLPKPIPRSESIENRTIKLLRYLEREHPEEQWGQFLEGDQMAWNKVAIGGMSQGGGHAALIATRHLVARVLCFGGPKDYSLAAQSPAKWYDQSITPPGRYFAFNNTHDRQGCDYEQQLEILAKLGIRQLGGLADVDVESPPYHGAHAMFTSWPGPNEPIESLPAHTSVLRDNLLGSDQRPIFRPVWIYMLTAPTDP